MNRVMVIIGCISAAAMLSGCGNDSGNQSSTGSQPPPVAAATTPAPAPAPATHNYSMVDNGTYGYEPALSEDDVRSGTATKPLIMMRYVGNKGGTYVIVVLGSDANNTGVADRLSCQAPCEFAKIERVAGDTVVNTQTLRVTPDSIDGAMLSDAISGQLIPFGQTTAAQQIMLPQTAPNAPTPSAPAPEVPAPEVPADAAPSQAAPLQGASFDCRKAKSASEVLICSDAELSRLDGELADVYRQAKANASDAQAFKQRTIDAWKWREANCHDKGCLMRWYADRKAALLQGD